MKKEITIGTFNVHNDYKSKQDFEQKTQILANYIYDNDISCLGLQEVTKKYSLALKKTINKSYGLYGDYRFKNCKLLKGLNESTKILSKVIAKKCSTIYLSKFLFFPRIMTVLETDDFMFINVHLEFWSNYFRKKELKKLYDFIFANREKNIILVGDFNAEKKDKNFSEFVNKLSQINIDLVQNDLATCNKKIIDYVFVSNKYKILDICVEDKFCDISDHKLLLVKITRVYSNVAF